MSVQLPELSTNLKQEVPNSIAWKYRVIPKEKNSDELVLYSDITDDTEKFKKQLTTLIGTSIRIEFATKTIIDNCLTKYYLRSDSNTKNKEFNVDSENFINEVIKEANNLGCSDIHIESYQDRCRIRMRLDGKLIERYELKKNKYHEYVNKLKILSNLDIAEKRLPQDGRILIKEQGSKYDIRVSILPTLFGEKVVLRLLSNEASQLEIHDLGLIKSQLETLKDAILKPLGMVLISGPTGSGKTTTLYAALKTLNKIETNILTIEDPIEYTLEGVNQVQLNNKVGLDFAKALRTFLRQDPDVIMVGEIRDVETANIAIRAAMTGHLVMSTLHTNSAIGIISRLTEMGIPPYLIADTLNIALAQRLVRLLCKKCKQKSDKRNHLPSSIKSLVKGEYFEPVGCESCHGTGYKGRKAIYEMIPVDEKIRELILGNQKEKLKFKTLRDNAITLFQNGETSLEEIYTYLI